MKKHLPTHLLLFIFLYLGALGQAIAQYCVPTHPSGCGNGDITLVRITGTTLNNVSSCGNGGYTVWPAQGSTTAVLRQNSGYSFNVTSSGSYVTVWVDWDQNQSFDDTETLIYGLSSPVASGFIVPSSARTGQTRMRVRSRQTSSTLAACGSQASGETEDYIVTVVAGQVPTVCLPFNYSACADGNITRVSLTGTGLDNSSNCSTDSAGNAYTIWPKQGSRTGVVRQGQTYSLDIAAGNAYVGLWVDWDQSNSFESTEQVLFGATAPVNFWLSIPANAVTGTTRMRVRTRTNSTTVNPCGLSATGETEDYFLTVIAGQSPIPCTPGHYNGCGNGDITRVQIVGSGLDKSSNCSVDTAGNAYTAWPATGSQTGRVRMGSTYSFKVNAGNTFVGAWADWDQSGTFETTEQILYGANAPVTGYLAVPSNARAGQVRLRIRTRTSSSSLDACTNYSNGEAEDYFLTVLPGSAPVPCTPGHYSGCTGGAITRVKITGTTLDNSSACTEDTSGNGYTIWPATGNRTGIVRQGSTYAFQATAASANVFVWVDWNANEVFESGEYMIATSSPVASYISVPTDAVPGQVRMRVRSSTSTSSLGACGFTSTGEAEDYFLTVVPGQASVPCTPGHYSGCSSGSITRVLLTGTTLNSTSSCNTDTAGNAYTVWPATGNRTGIVRQGSTYGFQATASGANVFVWADWNGNNVFESNEYMIATSSPVVSYISVPTDAVLGLVRIRVRSSSTTSSLTACGYTSTGEAEDYFVTVVAGTPSSPCTPVHYTGCGTGTITRVTLTGTTLNNTSTCATDSVGNAYTVWPATGSQTGILRQGSTYGFRATAPGAYVSVWVDWNQNNSFENSEYMILQASPVVIYLSVPTNAALGLTRMRVRTSTSSNPMSACDPYSVGEAEDYFVTVIAGTPPSPCTPLHFRGCSSEAITQVRIVGTTLNNTSTCATDSVGNAYTVWPATGSQTGILRQGSTYGFRATATGAYVNVWADWNQNNSFENSEYMILQASPVVSYLSVPANAAPGLTRIRVRTSTSSNPMSACDPYSVGEAEDYFVTVVAGQAPLPCTPLHFRGCSSPITQVKIVGTTLDNASTCATDSVGNAYTQWPATGSQTGVLRQGSTYGFRATASGTYVNVWADWNQNNSFENSEYMILQASPVATYLSVPTNAALGLTRIRVRNSTSSNPMSACDPYSVGEAEDYFVTVVAGTAPTVCTPLNFAGCGPAYVSRVAISSSGLDQSSTCSEDSSGNAYKVWPISGTSTGTLRQNQSYTLTANATAFGWISAWIDWNQDGTFASSELIGSSSNGSLSRTVTIPANAPSGYARMRVRSSASGSFSSSCNAVGQGETEDYWLAVINGPICNTGVFSYNISGVLCAGANVVLTPQFTAFSSAANFSAIPAGLALNAATGEVQVQNSQPGTYTVRNIVTAAGNCSADTGYATVLIVAQASAAFTYGQSTYCRTSGSDPVPTITGTPGGAFSAGTGLAINAQTGRISLANSVAGSYTVRYDITGTCAASSSVNITLTDPATASFVLADSLCTSGNTFVIPVATGSTRGAFSAVPTGLSLTSGGSLDLGASQPGQYTVTNTVTGTAGCPNATDSRLLTVVRQTTASFSYGSGSFCRSLSSASPTVTGTAGGRFSATPAGLSLNAVTGEINPATSTLGTYAVRYQVGGLCPSSSSVNVSITSAATSSFTIPPTACTYDGNIVAQTGPGSIRGVFSAQPNGLSIDANGSISPSTSVPGRYVVTNTVAGGTGCPNSVSTDTIEVFAEPTVTISVIGSESFCQGDSAKLVASGANSYVWSTGATTPTIIVRSTGAYQVQGRGAGGCVGVRGQRIDVFIRPATPVITLTGGGTSLTSNAVTGNQWLLDGQPIAGATGQTYTIPANGSGTYSALVRDGNGCDSDTSNTIVVVVSGVAGRQHHDWQFYPNPSEGRIQIAAPSRIQGELALYDALGRNVYEAVLAGQDSYELHLENLPKGVYQAMVRTAAGVQTYRITLR